MTDSAHMASAPLKTLLPNALSPNKVVVDGNGIHDIVSIDRITLAPYIGQGSDGTDKDSNSLNASNSRNKDENTETMHAYSENLQCNT